MILLWTFVFVDVLVIVCVAFMPFLTRKTELFGVSIPSGETNRWELTAMRRGYRNIMVIVGLAMIAAQLFFQLNPALNGGLTLEQASDLEGNGLSFVMPFVVIVCAYCVFGFLLYLHYHKCTKSYKKKFGWYEAEKTAPVLVADTAPAYKETISLKWMWLYVGIAAATAIAAVVIWPDVPDKIVTNIGFDGTPDAWTPKGPGVVMLLASQWGMLGAFWFSLLIVRHAKRQILTLTGKEEV